MEVDNSATDIFDAEKFVKTLVEDGSKCPCDGTVSSFRDGGSLPEFYDKELFKRGQRFFQDNIFALFYSKFLGLLSILAVPTVTKMLIQTKKSGSPQKAYKRYLSTIFHMIVWYQSDFSPGSKLWRSLLEVKTKHKNASELCCAAGLSRITQKDMAFTQFGFMGFALAKRERIGLYSVKDEDLKSFVHVWRVLGAVMGIEDRFNICRESLEETVEICKVIGDVYLKSDMEKKNEDFLQMATHLADGMWSMNPTINAKIYLNLVYHLLHSSSNEKFLIEMSVFQQILFNFILAAIWALQFRVCKVFCNYIQHVSLWLMNVFPFLAYYQFGYANSYVAIQG